MTWHYCQMIWRGCRPVARVKYDRYGKRKNWITTQKENRMKTAKEAAATPLSKQFARQAQATFQFAENAGELVAEGALGMPMTPIDEDPDEYRRAIIAVQSQWAIVGIGQTLLAIYHKLDEIEQATRPE